MRASASVLGWGSFSDSLHPLSALSWSWFIYLFIFNLFSNDSSAHLMYCNCFRVCFVLIHLGLEAVRRCRLVYECTSSEMAVCCWWCRWHSSISTAVMQEDPAAHFVLLLILHWLSILFVLLADDGHTQATVCLSTDLQLLQHYIFQESEDQVTCLDSLNITSLFRTLWSRGIQGWRDKRMVDGCVGCAAH